MNAEEQMEDIENDCAIRLPSSYIKSDIALQSDPQ
jgi:hypothetical protein